MAIPKSKTELLAAIQAHYAKLEKELIDISSEEAAVANLEGHKKGSTMSICNLLSYLIGWGVLVLKWNTQIKDNERVEWPEKGFKWTELGLLAQKFYKDYKHLSYLELKQELNATVQQLVSLVDSHSNEALYDSAWYKTYSMGRMIQLNTSSPYKNARTRIRKWKKANRS